MLEFCHFLTFVMSLFNLIYINLTFFIERDVILYSPKASTLQRLRYELISLGPRKREIARI